MDNNTAVLKKFLCRDVLVEKKSVQMWSPALGALRERQFLKRSFYDSQNERFVCSIPTTVKGVLATQI